jgi:ribosomal protein S2
MYHTYPSFRKGMQHLTQKVLSFNRPNGRVPEELQDAINGCKTMDQLLHLLFTTDFVKDEAIIDAFDRRIDELEKSA